MNKIWEGWKRIAARIGLVQSNILLSIVYVLVVSPFALMVKAFTDPLRLQDRGPGGFYVERSDRLQSVEEARRQS